MGDEITTGPSETQRELGVVLSDRASPWDMEKGRG